MTKNQIEYARVAETARANRAIEQQTSLRDAQTIALQTSALAETSRHNRQQEKVSLGSLRLQQQTADRNWSIALQQTRETARSNRARELETYRSNLARETEQHRSNTANEVISLRSVQESERANRARERTNQAQVEELARANRASEAIRRMQVGVDQQRVNLGLAQLSESQRQADLNFWIQQDRNIETSRANQARELETSRANRTAESEQRRHNFAVERETQRANIRNEQIQQQNADSRTTQALTGVGELIVPIVRDWFEGTFGGFRNGQREERDSYDRRLPF